MDVQLFIHDNLAVHAYYSKDSFVDGVLAVEEITLFFPGLPQMIDKRFFENHVSKNRAFFYVYYYGTWLSGATFSPENSRKSVTDSIEFVKRGKGVRTFDGGSFSWEFKKLSILGCSFAGNPILTSNLSGTGVSKIELYAPLSLLEKNDRAQWASEESNSFDSYNEGFLYFMRNGYKNVLRGIEESVWDSYFKGDDSRSKINLLPGTPPIMIFQGVADKAVKKEWTTQLADRFPEKISVTYIEGYGHDFISLFNHINKK